MRVSNIFFDFSIDLHAMWLGRLNRKKKMDGRSFFFLHLLFRLMVVYILPFYAIIRGRYCLFHEKHECCGAMGGVL